MARVPGQTPYKLLPIHGATMQSTKAHGARLMSGRIPAIANTASATALGTLYFGE